MTYEGATRYLSELGEARIRPGLTRITQALNLLGTPHLRYRTVLVGGTNGKGSTVAFLSSILLETGLRVGMFTSPHLIRFEERIRVDGVCLPENDMPGLLDTVRRTGIELSYFETAAAMAMTWFGLQSVDVAVLEVGLGGRWDATNAADPEVSVITTVDLDHTDWLGSTIPEVAAEKAQIMRPGRPIIAGQTGEEATSVLAEEAGKMGALLRCLGRDFSMTRVGDRYTYRGTRISAAGLNLGMEGRYQAQNAACAMAVVEALTDRGFEFHQEAVRRGLALARWPGRFETLSGRPSIILDCAHNPAAMKALAGSLAEGAGPVAWVFSALSDKDVKGMAEVLAEFGGEVYLVGLGTARAMDLGTLTEVFCNIGVSAHRSSGLDEAIDLARQAAGPGGRVVVTGSIYLVGRAMEALQRKGLADGRWS